MKKNYFIIAIVIPIVCFLAWYFRTIVAYVLISAILALIAKPVIISVRRIRIKGKRLPSWLGALAGLATVSAFFYLFFSFFIPLIADQAKLLGMVDLPQMIKIISEPVHYIESWIGNVLPSSNFSIQSILQKKLTNIFDVSFFADSFGSIANFIVSMAVAIFSIAFISFFFMKEESLFVDSVVILMPSKYEVGIRHAWASSTQLLTRYFIGVIVDMICILIIITLGLKFIAGMNITTALLIGLIAGILNVIPYVGPLIAAGIGTIIAIAGCLDGDASGLSSLIFKVLIVFVSAKIIDDVFLQPNIFANSVKAHPLEIFLLILIAGSIAGIGGMLVAIPAYTVFRVFAKEFFNNFRVIQKLTKEI